MSFTPNISNLKFHPEVMQNAEISNEVTKSPMGAIWDALSSPIPEKEGGKIPEWMRIDNLVKNAGSGVLQAGQGLNASMGGLDPRVQQLASMNMNPFPDIAKVNPNEAMHIKPGMEVPALQTAAKYGTALLAPEAEIGQAPNLLRAAAPKLEQFAQMLARKTANPALIGAAITPENRGGGAIEGGLAPAVESGATFSPEIEAAAKKAFGYIGDQFRPEKAGQQLMQSISHGATTAEENINNFMKQLFGSAEHNKKTALGYRAGVDEELGGRNVLATEANQNLGKLAKEFNAGNDNFHPEELSELEKATKEYKKNDDIHSFVEKGEDIFNQEGITPNRESNIEAMVQSPNAEFSLKQPSSYLGSKDKAGAYKLDNERTKTISTEEFKDLHEKFKRNPTFENADNIEKSINTEINDMKNERLHNGTSNDWRLRMEKLSNMKSDIAKDKDRLLKRYPEHKESMQKFKTSWKEDYEPYKRDPGIRRVIETKPSLFSPDETGWTPSQLAAKTNSFFRTKNGSKILDDLGPEGKDRLLFNLIKNNGIKADEVDKYIGALIKDKVGARFISDDVKRAAAKVQKTRRNREIAQNTAIGLTMVKNPVIGGIGAAIKHGGKIVDIYKRT